MIRLLFAPEFEESRYIVPFSAFAFVLYGAYTIVATGLSIVGRTGILATTMLVAAGVALGLNLILIPVLGMYGAAISTARRLWPARHPRRLAEPEALPGPVAARPRRRHPRPGRWP